jgi:predicted DNA-binding protein
MAKGSPTVVIRLPADERERWAAAAKKAGLSLSAFVRQAVERVIDGEVAALMPRNAKGELHARTGAEVVKTFPLVDPRKCTARVHAGAYCRRCGAIHTKGNVG